MYKKTQKAFLPRFLGSKHDAFVATRLKREKRSKKCGCFVKYIMRLWFYLQEVQTWVEGNFEGKVLILVAFLGKFWENICVTWILLEPSSHSVHVQGWLLKSKKKQVGG